MQHRSIQYWETFPTTNGGWVKMVDEILLEPGESPRDAFYEGMRTVQSTFYEMKGLAAKQAAEKKEVNEEPKMSQEAKIIAQIYDISDLKVLGSFALLAAKDREKNGENSNIHAAYQQQLEKLK